ncbi:MAG TPA: YdeI/OmpD-associated family protein [Acidobacteriaceae bacterium]|nr:YdeI/OmpD-associated family protein [Acidobacteriaceae bacterium]
MSLKNSYSAAVDAYISSAAPFAQPILEHVRSLMHKAVPEVEETIKWSMPFFTVNGIILGNLAAFKEHCSFAVWHENVSGLRKEGVEVHGGGMGSFGKLRSRKDLPDDRTLKTLIAEAAEKIKRGERTKNWAGRQKKDRPKAGMPEALAAALKKNKTKQFAAMPPGAQREYIEWIAEAKREETRDRRVATAMEWIAEGKRRNWQYEGRA